MPEAVSAVPGAAFDGFVRVEEAGLQGMITLRGDLAAQRLKAAVRDVVGVDVPEQRCIAMAGESGAAWMSPDELLLLCPHARAQDKVVALGLALDGTHHMVVNVSDARAVFQVSGAGAREVAGKLCPMDFAPGAFEPGEFRRTRMAQVAAAVWMEGAGTLRVVCARSVAQYVFDLLKVAAQPGSAVGVYGVSAN